MSLLVPTLSYKELVVKLKSHFSLKPIAISEQFKVYEHKQQANEWVAEFSLTFADSPSIVTLTSFWKEPCEIDWSVDYIAKRSREALGTFTLSKAVDMALGQEAAIKSSRDLHRRRIPPAPLVLRTTSNPMNACNKQEAASAWVHYCFRPRTQY